MIIEHFKNIDLLTYFKLTSQQDIYNKVNKVYTINIITNDKIYQYVGQTRQPLRKRISQHLHRNHIVNKTIQEHYNEIEKIEISYKRTYKGQEQLNNREKQDIRKSNKNNKVININEIKYVNK